MELLELALDRKAIESAVVHEQDVSMQLFERAHIFIPFLTRQLSLVFKQEGGAVTVRDILAHVALPETAESQVLRHIKMILSFCLLHDFKLLWRIWLFSVAVSVVVSNLIRKAGNDVVLCRYVAVDKAQLSVILLSQLGQFGIYVCHFVL